MTEPKGLPEKTGVISRQAAFSKASAHVTQALDVIIEIMQNPRMNPNARLGAARTIIDKVLPDLKAAELTGAEGSPLGFTVVIKDYGTDSQPPTQTTGSLPEKS